MSQGYAIELYFDPALENQVLKAWNIMARRRVTTHLIEIESRPHITLFSTQFAEPSKLETLIKTFAARQDPLHLSFSAIGGENNALFLVPTPTLSLLQVHSQLCGLLRKEGVDIGDGFSPDSWMPVCPVAEEVLRSRVVEGFSVLRDLKLPVSGYATEIGLVEFYPVRELCSFVMGKSSVDG